METISKMMASVTLGLIASFQYKYGILTLLVCGAIVLDLITGILKAKITHKLSSKQGRKGFWKKVSLLSALAFGFLLDCIESYLIKISFGQPPVTKIAFGMIIGVYIILNEGISICENLTACGVKLPHFISQALKCETNKIDKKN